MVNICFSVFVRKTLGGVIPFMSLRNVRYNIERLKLLIALRGMVHGLSRIWSLHVKSIQGEVS